MVDVNLQKGFAMPDDDDDDDDDKNTVREWEDGLPSLADLISLSQCLISPQLASAFSITSPSLAPSRSSADVALASHAAFSSLRAPRDPQLDPSPTSPDSLRVLQRCLTSGDAQGARHSELVGGHDAIVPYEKNPGASAPPGDPLKRKNSNVSVRPDDKPSFPPEDVHYQDRQGDEFQGRSAAADAKVDGLGIDSAQEHKDRLQSFGVQEDNVGFMNERNVEPEGEGCAEMNAQRPCSSEGSDAAHRLEADVEAEDAESTPSLAENPNGEVQARTLKRPRLVWTQELHKRFVDAVTHLGLRTAVPKTIMQLMNVEGLTRENVASHLQKYRLYLKRMQQGLGGEASASSDHIFASTPLPVNLVTSGRFPPGVPSQLQDVNQVPFLLSGSHVPINRGHVAGILPAPLPPMDPYSYGAYSRPAHRITQGEMPDLHWWRQHHSDPNHPVMKK